jgi:NAD(P)-dependent dehydrogenase (short-subunit alcohol dehydrogenase family)
MGSSASKAVGGTTFNPAADIPNLTGKTILITGGNSGLGRQSIIDLSKHDPQEIWLAARTLSKAETAIKEVKNQSVLLPPQLAVIKPLEMDLASMDSVARAAEVMRTQTHRLDILILNAGIMATPPGVSRDGYEIQFATNYLGHVFLVSLLLPVLLAAGPEGQQLTGGARVVLLSSVAHRFAPRGGINFQSLNSSEQGLSTVARYRQSKLAVLLYGRELARRYPEFTVVVVHPGQVRTNLGNTASSTSLLMRALWTLTSAVIGVEPERGVLNQLWAATAPAEGLCSGAYYEPVGRLDGESKMALRDGLAEELWDLSCGVLSRYHEHLDGQ